MWKQIDEFQNYEISDKGEVRNIQSGKVLKPWIGVGGYEPKDECAKEYEELGLKELKELIEADRKTEQTEREGE